MTGHFNLTLIRICGVLSQSEGGDPERRHETPWARDGWGSGAGQSFFVSALRRRVRAPARPATHTRQGVFYELGLPQAFFDYSLFT